ncbi:hypothetical protein BEWA_048500 [Theileria equi strain WA]|uniref:Uncharacterized protein n=1 Tax=Theileria equi strain WA TaxID=1537102 RepID=L1LB56_THEEQ|nr:hypothetical protein BEWA_048500 [Theileria equi strain WA]EKX72383.1 hypothetical protein BEWA_048500 [Theileria equi strain WA]|eukprot:XP_004831835.1 hypothetical protein BEWA_048500 [Theileria equi strain WA]
MTTLIDISRKCNGSCTCYVNQDKDVKATRNDSDAQLGKYGCCTHISKDKKLALYWRNINLETTSGIPFTQLESVTTYYHKHYEPGTSIKRPLIIKVETNAGNTLWYENAEHHVNKKWRKIGETNYYKSNSELRETLTQVACRLYGYHQIDIHYIGKYRYKCLICGEHVTGEIKPKNSPGSTTGYTKYTHGEITEKSILTHNGNKITYKRRGNGEVYYIPIPINDPANIKNISAYYWEEDKKCENPLLIEIGLNNGDIPFWFENIRELDGENDKWRQLGRQESTSLFRYGIELQTRLDILNCNINGVVHIKFGVTKCHSYNSIKHKNRIDSVFTRTLETSLISSYEYTPSDDSRNEPFVVSKFFCGGIEQSFPVDALPLREVKNLIYYMSPCDISNPFLVYAKSNGDNKWFKRTNRDIWENCVEFSNKTPEKANNEIITLFNKLKASLGISECLNTVHSYSSGVKLDINEIPTRGERNKIYKDRNASIIVTKTERDPKYRFFKNTHTSTKIPFVLDYYTQGRDRIGGKKIPNAENVAVYFWDGAPTNPILIGVTTENGHPKTKYYGKRSTNSQYWMLEPVERMSEQQALDHQNCKLNNTIPFDIQDPLLFSASNSNCLNTKAQVISSNGSRQIGKDDKYLIEYYKINKHNVKISRATYKTEDTTVIPPNTPVSQIKLYYWGRGPSEPLMVEFRHNNGRYSTWFERLTHTGTVWEPINEKDSEAFYSESPKLDATPQFINRLDKVSCTINRAVNIDISKKDVKYCHNKCLNKRIYSKRVNSEIPNYIIYEHTSAINGQDRFMISSIYNDTTKQDIGNLGLNLYDVEKLTVFFPTCNERVPIVIRIEHMVGPRKEEKWLERISNDSWRDVTRDFKGKADDITALKNLLESIKDTTRVCNQPHLPSPQYINPRLGTALTLDNETIDVRLKNDIGGDELDFGDEEYYEVSNEDKLEIPTLSALKSPPNGITINVKKKPSGGDSGTYILPDGQVVKLEKSEDPKGSGFWKFTHTKNGEKSFKVDKVEYDNKIIDTSKLPILDNKIEYLSVWYWRHNGMLNPLLIEVMIENGEYIHIKNLGDNNWVKHTRDRSEEKSQFQGESLEKELDDLNCKHNDAVTLDLSHKKSEGLSKKYSSSENDNRYCCLYHNGPSSKRVSVKEQRVYCTQNNHHPIPVPYFKHDVSNVDKVRLAKIKYYLNGANNTDRKRVTLSEYPFPIDGPLTVSVFYCKDKDPVLIYLDYNGKKDAKGWYKKDTLNGDDVPWIKVTNELSGKSPDDIKNCSDERFKALVKELSSFGCKYGQCPEFTKSSLPESVGGPSATVHEPHAVNDDKSGGYLGEGYLKTLVNLGIMGSVVASAVGTETLRTTLGLAKEVIDALPTTDIHTGQHEQSPESSDNQSHAHEDIDTKDVPGGKFQTSSTISNNYDWLPHWNSLTKRLSGSLLPSQIIKSQDSSKANHESASPDPQLDTIPSVQNTPSGSVGGQSPALSGDGDRGADGGTTGEVPHAESGGRGSDSTAQGGAGTSDSEKGDPGKPAEKVEVAGVAKSTENPQTSSSSNQGSHPEEPPKELATDQGRAETLATSGADTATPTQQTTPSANPADKEAQPGQVSAPKAGTAPKKPESLVATTGGVLVGYIIPSVFGGSGAAGLAGWKLYNRYKGDPWVRQI